MAEHECTTRMRAVAEYMRCDVRVTETPPDGSEPDFVCRHDVPMWIRTGAKEEVR